MAITAWFSSADKSGLGSFRAFSRTDTLSCCSADPSDCIEKRILSFKEKREEHDLIYPEKAKGDLKIVYIRGDDWQDFPGKEVLEKHNIPIIFKPYTKGISSSLIRENLETVKCGCKLEMKDGCIFDPEIKKK